MAIRSIEQVEMNQVRLECPVADEAIADLKLGDLVYLDGLIYTGREGLYRRMLDEGIEPPVPAGPGLECEFSLFSGGFGRRRRRVYRQGGERHGVVPVRQVDEGFF